MAARHAPDRASSLCGTLMTGLLAAAALVVVVDNAAAGFGAGGGGGRCPAGCAHLRGHEQLAVVAPGRGGGGGDDRGGAQAAAPAPAAGGAAGGGALVATTPYGSCSAAEIEETEAAMRDTFHDLDFRHKRRGFTVGEALLHPCAQRHGPPLDVRTDVAFAVMVGSVMVARLKALRSAWLQFAPQRILMGDKNDAEWGMETLPELEGLSDRGAAQHRSLKGLFAAVKRFPDAAWYMMVDDDTWVNLPELEAFLGQFDARLPLEIGYQGDYPATPISSAPAAGSGLVFSRPAALKLAEKVYGADCPFDTYNDITIGRCAWVYGIPMVHSPLFDMDGESWRTDSMHGGRQEPIARVGIHRAYPKEMAHAQRVWLERIGGAWLERRGLPVPSPPPEGGEVV